MSDTDAVLVCDADEARELLIAALARVVESETDPVVKHFAAQCMREEINSRSPQQIKRMERERGLL